MDARRRYRFQYDMSINDTPLTKALEKGDFTAAVVIIKNSVSDPESLDEGPYERFPLYIVVSGSYGASEGTLPNLQIAQLLLEHGAQANKRGTVYNDMEPYSRSASPMELLVDIFRNLQLHHKYKQPVSPVIGLDGLVKVQYADIRDHLLGLMQVFIGHGGRLSFHPGILGVTHLVNILWTSPDVDFLRCLYEAGVDVNQVDVHGRTALHLLCQADYPPEFRDMRLQAINYLLKNTNVQASKYSCKEHSCLWYALKHGHFDAASSLLSTENNLDHLIGAKAFLSTEPEACHSDVLVAERIPALLIPFVPVRDIYLSADTNRYPNAYAQETEVFGPIAKFVDQGFFCDLKTEASISKILDWNPKFQMHSKMLSCILGKCQLVPFLFGRSSTKLKVLCARQIFQTCLIPHKNASVFESFDQDEGYEMDFDDCDNAADRVSLNFQAKERSWCSASSNQNPSLHSLHLSPEVSKLVFDVSFEDLALLLENLRLPLSFLNVFEFELYRRKLLIMLSHSDSDRLKCTCLADEQMRLEDVDSEESSTDDDSDIEGDGEAVSLLSVNFLQ